MVRLIIELIKKGDKIMTEIKPFLKWAGGKRKLLPTLHNNFPNKLVNNEIDTYIEPFLGGGSVALSILEKYNIKNIILNDMNHSLITTYVVVQNKVDELITELLKIENNYLLLEEEERKEYFYTQRKEFNFIKNKNVQVTSDNLESISLETIQLASLFIFLNKTCFNGLYRENLKGEFNVPHGRYKNPLIADTETLYIVSHAIKKATFLSGDFEKLTPFINNHSFLYMDPPYRPLNASDKKFNGYSKESFDDSDQKRLALWCREIDELGGLFLQSNSNPKNYDSNDTFFENLYDSFSIQNDISAARVISSKASTRKNVFELLIKNY